MLKIFTLNWKAPELLQNLITSTLPNLTNIDYEWYVRDNAATIDSEDSKILAKYPQIKVLSVDHNRDNFSQGMNSLFNISNSQDDDYILLLNNDIFFKDNTSIKNMIKLMESDSEIGVVGAKLNYKNSKKIQHCGVVFKPHEGGYVPLHLEDQINEEKHHRKNREFQVVTGAVWLTKAKYYKDISPSGGLDVKFHWAFDDVAACLSIKNGKHKKKIMYCGSTNIEHESSASLKKNPSNKMFLNQNYQFLMKDFKNVIIADQHLYQNKNYKVV